MKKIIAFSFLILLFNCQNKTIENSLIENEKAQISVVKDFMKWYMGDNEDLRNINPIKGGYIDETEPAQNYYIDFEEVEKHLEIYKKSGFLSNSIIQKERQAFKETDIDLKENPLNDGPVFGFDYDHFFLTQESFEDDLKNIEKLKYNVRQRDELNAEVRFQLPCCGKYKYSLKKINSKWLIDKIETENN